MAKQTIEDVIRDRDHLALKVQQLETRVRELEFDCATLQRRDGELNQRLKELSYQKVLAHRQQNPSPRRNFNRR
jgi:chaperonin cofactor prefoldin